MHYLKLAISWLLLIGMVSDVVFVLNCIVYFQLNSLMQILLSISFAILFFKIRSFDKNLNKNWFFGTTIICRFIIRRH